jgi:WD40 repeat protein
MGGRNVGSLQLFVVGLSDKPEIDLEAANHQLSLIRFNPTGTMMATVSARGTLIRLFDTKSGNKIGEFKRGSFKADICSISFSPDSKRLVVLSNKGTIHLFNAGNLEAGVPDAQRAVLKWKMPGFEPGVVEFLSQEKFGFIRFKSGIMDLFKVDVHNIAITPDGSISIIDVK